MKTLLVLTFCLLAQIEAYRLPGLGQYAKTDNEYPTFQVGKFLSAIRNHIASYAGATEPEQPRPTKKPKQRHRHGHGYGYGPHGEKLIGVNCIGDENFSY